jgi:hypothetical protein
MKREKWFWLMLLLAMGAMLMISCEQVEDDAEQEEEELPGASRPIYTGDGSDELPQTNNLSGSTWLGASDDYTLRVVFNNSTCLFTGYDFVAKKDTTANYTYRFSWPVLTLTPESENGGVVIGTAVSMLSKYTMTFVDEVDSVVWKQVEIRRTSTFR